VVPLAVQQLEAQQLVQQRPAQQLVAPLVPHPPVQ